MQRNNFYKMIAKGKKFVKHLYHGKCGKYEEPGDSGLPQCTCDFTQPDVWHTYYKSDKYYELNSKLGSKKYT